jgi:hypothetical protein
MAASLALSIRGERRAEAALVTEPDGHGAAGGAAACAASEPAAVFVARPAPTLGPAPRRFAGWPLGRAPAPEQPAIEANEANTAPPPADGTRLDQASRTAQMLREQLNASVR